MFLGGCGPPRPPPGGWPWACGAGGGGCCAEMPTRVAMDRTSAATAAIERRPRLCPIISYAYARGGPGVTAGGSPSRISATSPFASGDPQALTDDHVPRRLAEGIHREQRGGDGRGLEAFQSLRAPVHVRQPEPQREFVERQRE